MIQALERLHSELSTASFTELFQDSTRVDQFSFMASGFYFDFSKQKINTPALQKLIELAESLNLKQKIDAMFAGDIVNKTENRAVLHTALRSKSDCIEVNGKNIMPEIRSTLEKMQNLSSSIISGELQGYSGQPFTDVVNIGIGGSDLGPALVYDALPDYHTKLKVHFVSNLDEQNLNAVLAKLNPETTLFIVTSKSFTTIETLTNANTAKKWLDTKANGIDTSAHWFAVSSNIDKVTAFGVCENHILPMWDWVGGRYSLWSAVGFCLVLGFGFEHFQLLLDGANEIDQHFLNTTFDQNIPVIMGLLSYWYTRFFHAETEAVIPYDQRLKLLPDYLQQAQMESLGKRVDIDGNIINDVTGNILWGGLGTNSQHAFHQLLMQGTHIVPIDFIAIKNGNRSPANSSSVFANCLSQSHTMAFGVSENDIEAELISKGMLESQAKLLAKHKSIPGGNPSTTIVIKDLTPHALGALIACYEHKIFVESVVFNINAFDQWGVERGKVMASAIESADSAALDPSTQGLLKIWDVL